jgi:hypothetical protein
VQLLADATSISQICPTPCNASPAAEVPFRPSAAGGQLAAGGRAAGGQILQQPGPVAQRGEHDRRGGRGVGQDPTGEFRRLVLLAQSAGVTGGGIAVEPAAQQAAGTFGYEIIDARGRAEYRRRLDQLDADIAEIDGVVDELLAARRIAC